VSRDDEPLPIDALDATTKKVEVVYTYDVTWEPLDVAWAARWNQYLRSGADDDIHWFSIVNSLMIVLFLTGMIAMILMRNLYRDIARYNDETSTEEAAEETGWKLVHGDVFRPPAGFFGPMFLSVFVGSGMQILAMAVTLLVFAVLGFLSPANTGSLLTAFIVLYMLMGSFAGYFSARLYKMFKGKAWKRNTTLTAVAFPGTLFTIALALNFLVMSQKSSLAVPFPTIVFLLFLWGGVSVPLVFVGSFFGFKKDEIRHPVRVNNIPRQIPPQPWYLHPVPSVLVGGILPFGAVFIELFFIMSSIWLAQVYYVFGFLFLVLLILIVTCAEISIVMAYFQLCSEDYNWWWRSFLTSGSSAVYLFAYSVVYFTCVGREVCECEGAAACECWAVLQERAGAQSCTAYAPSHSLPPSPLRAPPPPLPSFLVAQDEAGHHGARVDGALLWLHGHGGVGLLPADGVHRLRRDAHLRQQGVRLHQGRLRRRRTGGEQQQRMLAAGEPVAGAPLMQRTRARSG